MVMVCFMVVCESLVGVGRDLVFIYYVLPSPPTLVFGDARNRHNEITLERVGNMSHAFTDNPPTQMRICVCCLFMKAWFAVLRFEVERYFFM